VTAPRAARCMRPLGRACAPGAARGDTCLGRPVAKSAQNRRGCYLCLPPRISLSLCLSLSLSFSLSASLSFALFLSTRCRVDGGGVDGGAGPATAELGASLVRWALHAFVRAALLPAPQEDHAHGSLPARGPRLLERCGLHHPLRVKAQVRSGHTAHPLSLKLWRVGQVPSYTQAVHRP